MKYHLRLIAAVFILALAWGCSFGKNDGKDKSPSTDPSEGNGVDTGTTDDDGSNDGGDDDINDDDGDTIGENINLPPPLNVDADFVASRYNLPFYTTTFVPSCINVPEYVIEGEDAWITITVEVTAQLADEGLCFPAIAYQSDSHLRPLSFYIGDYPPPEYATPDKYDERIEYCQTQIGTKLLALNLKDFWNMPGSSGPGGFLIQYGEYYLSAPNNTNPLESQSTFLTSYNTEQIRQADIARFKDELEKARYTKHCSKDDPFIGNSVKLDFTYNRKPYLEKERYCPYEYMEVYCLRPGWYGKDDPRAMASPAE